MAKNIQFEQENNEGFEEGAVVEKEAKKENSLISKVKGLKKWQKGLLIGGAAIGLGFAGTKLIKVIFGNKEAAQEVVENVVETTTEAVSEAAPF